MLRIHRYAQPALRVAACAVSFGMRLGWCVVLALASAVATSRADSATPQLSLHVLQEPNLPARNWGAPVKRIMDVHLMSSVDRAKWPPRLRTTAPPAKVLKMGAASFERDFERALLQPNSATRLTALQGLLGHVTKEQAHYVWWQIATLHDRPRPRAQALRQALAVVAKQGSLTNATHRSLVAARLALLDTLAWHGDQEGRLKLAAEILARGPDSATKRAALEHARDALLEGARSPTVAVPIPVVLELAGDMADLTRYGAHGPPRRALDLMVQHGDEATKQLALKGITEHDERLLRQPWVHGGEDPKLNVGPLYTLLRDCLALHAAPKRPVALNWGPGGSQGAVHVAPLDSPLAHCLQDRGPEYLEFVRVRVQAELPFGQPPSQGQFSYDSFVIVGTHRTLEQARRRTKALKARLGIPTTRDDIDPKTDEWFFRGRWDDGVYLSIENSDAYDELQDGYYVVVAASGTPRSPAVTRTLNRARRAGVNAYVRDLKVYMGCMH